MKKFKTADGFSLSKIGPTEPLFIVKKDKAYAAIISDSILMLVIKNMPFSEDGSEPLRSDDPKVIEYLSNVFYTKQNAEDEAFRLNKLSYHPRIEDHKGNYKKALKIIANFTDSELVSFVRINIHKVHEDGGI